MVTQQRLPRSVTVLQAGLVLNAFGNGAANPFVLLYLHEARGIPLGVAGLAASTSAACALVASLVAGSVADRIGARRTLVGGLLVSTAGFALLPFVRNGRDAIVVAVLTGTGIGTWLTGQSSLVALLTPPKLLPLAFARQRVAANVGLGLGAFAGGMIVTASDASSFTRLFALNAATFAVYGVVVLRLPGPGGRSASRVRAGTYRDVLRDGVFARFALVNLAFVAAAISLLTSVVPVFATGEAGVSERAIGSLFLLNSLTIVLLQVPITRRQAGRRRMVAVAQMGALFAASWLLVLLAGVQSGGVTALVALGAAFLVFSLGECLYDAVQGPLTADLAPDGMTGRYMAVNGFSWQLGFIVGPATAATVLGAEPLALWPLAAGVCLLAGLYAIAIEPRLEPARRRTPSTSAAATEARQPAPSTCATEAAARALTTSVSSTERARSASPGGASRPSST